MYRGFSFIQVDHEPVLLQASEPGRRSPLIQMEQVRRIRIPIPNDNGQTVGCQKKNIMKYDGWAYIWLIVEAM